MRSSFRVTGLQNQYREYITEYSQMDNLIFEDNQIKKYENSKQYIEDSNRYHLTHELEETKRKNSELEAIANAFIELNPCGELILPWNRQVQALNRPFVMGQAGDVIKVVAR